MANFGFETMKHTHFMQAVLKEAELAVQEGEWPVGAVLVHNGQIVSSGHALHLSRKSKIAHAEMNTLLMGGQYIYTHDHEDFVLYSTVEPCVMCLGAIVMSNISHIVYGLADRNIAPGRLLELMRKGRF